MRKKVEKILEGAHTEYSAFPEQREVQICVRGDTVAFDKLVALSDLFQTRKLSFSTVTREACTYNYSVVIICIEDVEVPL